MTAAEHLAQYGVTVAQAREFIFANLESPATIFNVANQYGVTNAMLAEIVGGVTEQQVRDFWSARGFDAGVLEGGTGSSGLAVLPSDLEGLASLIAFNTSTGILSTESLRAKVIAETSADWYAQAFDTSEYYGAEDGVFTPEELGFSSLGNFSATPENLESIYYGTIIKALKAIDMNEIMGEIYPFLTEANIAKLNAGDQAVTDQYVALMISVLEDPANPPIFTDAQIEQSIVMSTTAFVELVATGQVSSMFDNFLDGFA